MLLPVTQIETHPRGTTGKNAIIVQNWLNVEAILDPATSDESDFYGVIRDAIFKDTDGITVDATLVGITGGVGGRIGKLLAHEELTYATSVEITMNVAKLQMITLTGDIELTLANLSPGRITSVLMVATGADRDLTFPVDINWRGGAAPATIPEDGWLLVTFYSNLNTTAQVFADISGSNVASNPSGSDTQVQFNDGGVFGGVSDLTFDKTTGELSATSFVGDGSGVTNLAIANIDATGTPGVTNYLRGDGVWATHFPTVLAYYFSTSTAASNPGNQYLRYNTSVYATITQLYLSTLSINALAIIYFNSWGNAGYFGDLHLIPRNSPGRFLVFRVSNITNSGTYFTIDGETVYASLSLPSADDIIDITWFPKAYASGAITDSDLEMSTNRILGRTTAATGAVEEIAIGDGLALDAGVLSADGAGLGVIIALNSGNHLQ